jgi:hypothetical protein
MGRLELDKKICSVLGGMYIDVADKSVNLNPFQVSHDLLE